MNESIMADQKNATFLHYLRSFLKQGDNNCENGCGRPRIKRKGIEGLNDGGDPSPMSSEVQPCTSWDNTDEPLSDSNKRRCRDGQ
jgi:hypothetical protein